MKRRGRFITGLIAAAIKFTALTVFAKPYYKAANNNHHCWHGARNNNNDSTKTNY